MLIKMLFLIVQFELNNTFKLVLYNVAKANIARVKMNTMAINPFFSWLSSTA